LFAAVAGFLVAAVVFRFGGHRERTDSRSDEHGEHAVSGAEASVWTCAMHPQVRQPEPGKCPICGMDLIPVESSSAEQPQPERLVLSERAKALARLRTTEVRRQTDPAAEVPLLGRVEPDETTVRSVTAWVGGRIDRLHVRVTGERVRGGQTIATLYSPEVLAAHQDLIAARKQVDRMQGATELARSASQAALEAARDRLRLLGVAESRLQEMEGASQPARQIDIKTPFGGTVIERLANEGAYVGTGEALYRIADLGKVWVQLDAYERDLPSLSVGQAVRINVDGLPNESFQGRLAFIEPTLDPQRRTTAVRVEVQNPGGRLRPGMFAQAVVQGQAGAASERPLVVPHTAPLFTGRRAIVYVEVPREERPTYEARVVRLGPRAGDVYPVVAGLSEGERIVSRGAFVLDADLQIRGGSSMMTGPADDEPGPWDGVIELPSQERKKLAPVVESYLQIQTALAADDLAAAKQRATAFAGHLSKTDLRGAEAAREAWQTMERAMRAQVGHLENANSLEAARGPFEALSGLVRGLLERFGNPLSRPLRLAFCPMASGAGALWVQEAPTIDNPYFGEAMRTCGDFHQTVPPGGYLPRNTEAPPRAPVPAPEGHRH
jgi:Cu(I)/Ag(I) efflux system membrane fusion protein